MMPVSVAYVSSPTDDARALIGELDAELNADYPPAQRHGFSVDRVFQPDVLFFVARLDGEPAGCGAVALADGYGEVKRMYVRPQARGKNVAQAVLERIEQEARTRKVDRLVLETGDIRHAAMRFYERAGFPRCGAFGPYLDMPAHAIERSVFYEKRLA
jgi:putative acetyltransferase